MHHLKKKTFTGIGKRRIFNPRIQKAFGEIAIQMGDRAEHVVEEIFSKKAEACELPEWLRFWQHAKKYSRMDVAGIDFVFMTDVGPIFVNIKSSVANARNFNHKNDKKRIVPVVVNVCHTHEKIYVNLLRTLVEERNRLISHT